MREFDVAIIGGGPAGRVTVHTLYKGNPSLSIAVFKDEEVNVNRCAVPYGIDGARPLQKYQIPNSLVTDFGAELIVGKVVGVQAGQKNLNLEDGRVFGFKHLVFATGARPLLPPIGGIEAPQVIPVRSLRDLDQLRKRAAAPVLKRVVIVGGGYIGIEVGVVLREMGFAVTIVEMLPQILTQTTEPEFFPILEDLLAAGGVEVRTGMSVTAFGNEGETLAVALADGTTLNCDFAVLAAGVQLNTELAATADIAVNKFGIVVDEYLRTNYDYIFAAGDCAAKISLASGQFTRGEFGTNAVFMGRVVGANILGGEVVFPGVINANVTKIFAWGVGSAGLTENMARQAGLQVVTGASEVPDRYPMMVGVEKVFTKLVFERGTGRLLGGSLLQHGDCVVGNVDFISLAIQMGATWDDLLAFQYATHPELAAKPSDNNFLFAARAAQAKS